MRSRLTRIKGRHVYQDLVNVVEEIDYFSNSPTVQALIMTTYCTLKKANHIYDFYMGALMYIQKSFRYTA